MAPQYPRVFGIIAAAICLVVLTVPAMAVEPGPQGVSPGAPDRFARVGGACPTFSWEATVGAAHYDLVVHRYDEAARASSDSELSEETEVLFASVSGRATSWTPETSDCFAPGGAYVWFVRAVTDGESGDGSEWSDGRFFEVEEAPTADELERAIEVMQRWEAATGRGSQTRSTAPAPDSVAVADSGTKSSHPKSVATGIAAIRGEQPDSSGETYGVVGVSASPDGAGLGAANTAGGPDLVLDGTEDGETNLSMSQSGIERNSTQIEWFNFSNPGTGEIDVYVEGWTNSHEFVGGGSHLTGVDADTLDGTDGAAFATDVEAAGLVAAHAASADHDGRYYTQTELNSSGTTNAVHWNNLGGVPPGFADGIDNDTAYTMGPGLIIDGGEIQIDPAAFSVRITRVNSPADMGLHTSVAIGVDGLGFISCYNASGSKQLLVRHCADVLCTSTNSSVVESGGVGMYSSVAIGTDGYPLISYKDGTNSDLKVAHCENVGCSSASTYTLDSTGFTGENTSVAIGTDGLGLISYTDFSSGTLNVAHCANVECSSATISILDSGVIAQYDSTSVAIGADGLGLISYNVDDELTVAHCNNTDCSSASVYTLDPDFTGWDTSLAIGADGYGLISYYNWSGENLKVAHCSNTDCSNATISTLDSTGDVGRANSLAIGADGLGIISYYDATNGDLKVAHCLDKRCTSAIVRTVDSAGDVGQYTSLAIGADGLPLISYYDVDDGDLAVAHLPFWY
jgi:hypothetical protein